MRPCGILPGLGALLLLLTLALPAAAEPAVGKVTLSAGKPLVRSKAHGKRFAAVGIDVYTGDLIVTGAKERVVITFQDQMNLHVGPSSRLVLTEFVIPKERHRVRALIDLARGQIRLWTLRKLAEEDVQIRTRNAVAGMRGTTLEVGYWRWLRFSMVAVFDGEAYLRGPKADHGPVRSVKKGECGWVVKGREPAETRPMAEAPNFFRPIGDGTEQPAAFQDPWPSEMNDPKLKKDYP
jgi:hypothetical protein